MRVYVLSEGACPLFCAYSEAEGAASIKEAKIKRRGSCMAFIANS
jgi:hypothetical protein